MEHLVSTTNNVRLSFLLALLRDAGIKAHVFDANISALEAGIGAFPRRIMVQRNGFWRQKRCLRMQMNFMMIDHGRLSGGWQQSQPSQPLLWVTKT